MAVKRKGDFQIVLTDNFLEYQEIAKKIERRDTLIATRAKRSDACKRLVRISGFGPEQQS
ncbi:hypothetical protein AGMMS49925_07940 [Deltaproteobacteria bacterium]|nr:hypothetical protein AGMMS49925_07940 [Deltaproteobacteria bacterium]